MRELEQDLGLSGYSECERDIVCFGQQSSAAFGFDVSDLLADASMAAYSRPTVFRGLKALVGDNVLEKIGGERSGVYRLVQNRGLRKIDLAAERRA